MRNPPFPFQILDLTHTLDVNSPSWGGGCGFKPEVKLDYNTEEEGLGFRVQQIKMHAGIGTHIDAPAHCIEGGKTVENLPLKIYPGYCIDVSGRATENFCLSQYDIENFEKKEGIITPGAYVFLHTGWSRYWHTPKAYRNNHLFPSISEEAALFLLARGVEGVGIDTLSPDIPSSSFPVHKEFLSRGKTIIENFAHGEKLPSKDFYIGIFPLKGRHLTEAPTRIVAFL